MIRTYYNTRAFELDTEPEPKAHNMKGGVVEIYLRLLKRGYRTNGYLTLEDGIVMVRLVHPDYPQTAQPPPFYLTPEK